ncbi:PTS-dependent dihydroxyacetone kinase phosphotransferase subunit DhaM [Schaalia sp. 19OD2882]|uniref:dihydroxyacetone kinase phosphoryl donor subunit DhaM n=1 Tax=Schaalia sp. 19OD2882 TaxID=2794089 RepID=UPI001C1EF5BD|nr:dihydroxyacetone kinase phosphoryl donor subunit DhaM [Schaalia sp. 19OD2882]QWW18835.1 PTS-dependent dihydroxyacetone kinase phosphotransferase subunit DhaM [Schaalia sp. 19OD2882]
MSPQVTLVLVSHSRTLAAGAAELAAEMAPDVRILPAGGTDEGGIGTSWDKIEAAMREGLDAGDAVLFLTDLGSSTMTVEAVLETLEEGEDARFVDAPFVEAALLAAVEAQGGADLDAVSQSALAAAAQWCSPCAGTTSAEGEAPGMQRVGADAPMDSAAAEGDRARRVAVVADPMGLHARPAALLVKVADQWDAEITVNGADAGSMLEMMSLGVHQGDEVVVEASGSQAIEAVDACVAFIEGRA